MASPFIMINGIRAAMNARRVLIRSTCQRWIDRNPRWAKKCAWFLQNITKVEHNGGQWRHANALCKVRMPQDLFLYLRGAFDMGMPFEPSFGDDDSDIYVLYTEFPMLMPDPNRARRITQGVIL